MTNWAKSFDSMMSRILPIGGTLPSPERTVRPGEIIGTRRDLSGRDYLRTYLDFVVQADSVSRTVAIDPVLEQRIADEGRETSTREPDKTDPQPSFELLAYYHAPQGLTLAQYSLEATNWGIFLTTGGIEVLARHLQSFSGSLEQALRDAVLALYLHEFFHHTVASTSAMLQGPSHDKGTAPSALSDYESYRRRTENASGPNPLEEALANTFATRAFETSTRDGLLDFSRHQPVGYDQAYLYLDDGAFHQGCVELLGQIADCHPQDLGSSALILMDVEQRVINFDTPHAHLVETPRSAHAAGEWRLPW